MVKALPGLSSRTSEGFWVKGTRRETASLSQLPEPNCMARVELLIRVEVTIMHIEVPFLIVAIRAGTCPVQASMVLLAADGLRVLIKVPLLVLAVVALVHVDVIGAVHAVIQALVVAQCEDVPTLPS